MHRSITVACLAALVAGCTHPETAAQRAAPATLPAATSAPRPGAAAEPICAQPIPKKNLSGPGFTALAHADAGLLVACGDGTIRLGDTDSVPVLAKLPGPVLGLAVAPDGHRVAAVGFGFVAISHDGGRHYAPAPLPHDIAAFAVAWRGDELLVLDGEGTLWRVGEGGAMENAGSLPPGTRFALTFAGGNVGYAAGSCGHLLKTVDDGGTWNALTAPTKQIQGVLARGTMVLVSGAGGAWRSDDAGAHFTQVVQAGLCSRASIRGAAIALACSKRGRALWYAADGRHFAPVPAPDAANLLATWIAPDGSIVAGGAYDLLVRATPAGGHIVDTADPAVGRWKEILQRLEMEKRQREMEKRRPAPAKKPAPDKNEKKKPAPKLGWMA